MLLLDILSNVIVSISLIIAVVSAYNYSKFKPTQKYFIQYIFVAAFFEVLAKVWNAPIVAIPLRELGIENNLPGLHLFTLLQYILLLRFFHYVLKEYAFRVPLRIGLIIGVSLIVLNTVFFQSIFEFNSYSKAMVELFVIYGSVVFFSKVVQSDTVGQDRKVITLFVSAIFISAALSSLLYLFSNEIMLLKEAMKMNLWALRHTFEIITQLVILYGVMLAIRQRRETPSLIQVE